MWWLVYDDDDEIFVVIVPASTLIYARLAAAEKKLDGGTFIEGHRLDPKMVKRVAKKMSNRRLSSNEAEALLRKLA
jgi:hypothetical protein